MKGLRLGLGLTGVSAAAASYNPSVLFAASEPGAWYDFTDKSKLAVNADGTGGAPANGGTAKWAVDGSPNGNHLRNTVTSVAVSATGITTSGTGYGLFNMTGFGNWPSVAVPFEVIVTLEQVAYAAADARIIQFSDVGASPSLLQGVSSGAVRAYDSSYGTEVNPGIGAEFTLHLVYNGASSSIALNGGAASSYALGNTSSAVDLVLGSDGGASTGASIRFKRLLVIGRTLTAAERTAAISWAGA